VIGTVRYSNRTGLVCTRTNATVRFGRQCVSGVQVSLQSDYLHVRGDTNPDTGGQSEQPSR